MINHFVKKYYTPENFKLINVMFGSGFGLSYNSCSTTVNMVKHFVFRKMFEEEFNIVPKTHILTKSNYRNITKFIPQNPNNLYVISVFDPKNITDTYEKDHVFALHITEKNNCYVYQSNVYGKKPYNLADYCESSHKAFDKKNGNFAVDYHNVINCIATLISDPFDTESYENLLNCPVSQWTDNEMKTCSKQIVIKQYSIPSGNSYSSESFIKWFGINYKNKFD